MTAGPPPPRPSTARLTAPPIAARQDVPRPRLVTVSCRLWWLAGALAGLTVLFALTRVGAIRAELARVARDGDPSATPEAVGLAGALFALGLRAGRRWARLTLVALTPLAIGYGVLVVDATGWIVLTYSAVAVAAAVCMHLPGASRWLR
jgi:hypothetical protein